MSLTIFFFQAEDGIRDLTVTGVQTCALPIYRHFRLQICRGIPDAVRVAPGLLKPAVISNRSGGRAEQRAANCHGRGYLVGWEEGRRVVAESRASTIAGMVYRARPKKESRRYRLRRSL